MVVLVYQVYQWGINGVVRLVDTVRYMYMYMVICGTCGLFRTLSMSEGVYKKTINGTIH